MPNRNPRRFTERFAIDAELLADLRQEAANAGLPLERYVEQILATQLPIAVAAVMTDYVRRSIQLANTHDTPAAIEPKDETE